MRLITISGLFSPVLGGAIRDALLGIVPTDVDVATDAPPKLVENVVSESPAMAFAKGPKKGHLFGSYKVSFSTE